MLCTLICVLYVGEKPTEVDLREHVIKHVGRDWKQLVAYLGVPAVITEQAEYNNRNNVQEAFFDSLLWWHRGNSKEHPSTWEELLQALEETGFKDHADDLTLKLLHTSDTSQVESEFP